MNINLNLICLLLFLLVGVTISCNNDYVKKSDSNKQIKIEYNHNVDTIKVIKNKYQLLLIDQLKIYQTLDSSKVFQTFRLPNRKLSYLMKDSVIIQIKEILYLFKDLKLRNTSTVFDETLQIALKSFQKRTGLAVTGKLSSETMNELSIPIKYRIQQIKANLSRFDSIKIVNNATYIIVNIPEYKLHYFKNGTQLFEMDVIVGKDITPTNIFNSNISNIVINPYWNVPSSIVDREMLPEMKKNKRWLKQNKLEVLQNGKVMNELRINWKKYQSSIPYQIRQKPGLDNSLGLIKFLFPNKHDIYLHDTPAKFLFDKTNRNLSHGCIRVSDAKKLALIILEADTNYSELTINALIANKEEVYIKVFPTIPIHIIYFTAWVDNSGKLNFRKDIYALDTLFQNHSLQQLD